MRTAGGQRSGRSRSWSFALAAALLAGSTALGPAALASPGPGQRPVDDAQAEATRLRLAVDGLTEKIDAQSEHLADVQDKVAAALSARLAAQASADKAEQAKAGDARQASARVRSIYINGGPVTLYANALTSGDTTALPERIRMVQGVVDADRSRVTAAQDRLAAWRRATAERDAAAVEQGRLEKEATATLDGLQRDLAQQQQLLSSADAHVLELAEQQRQADEAAARAAFEAELRAQAAAAQASATPAYDLASLGDGSGPTSAAASVAVQAAMTRLGSPYVWGATGPNTFDCSGLTGWAYRQAGVSLPRVAAAQYLAGPHPAMSDLRPGDLVFWAPNPANPAGIDHMAMYIGGGKVVVAPHTGDVVKVQDMRIKGLVGATRVVPAPAAVTGTQLGPLPTSAPPALSGSGAGSGAITVAPAG